MQKDEKLTITQVIKISWWLLKMHFRFAPLHNSLFIASRILVEIEVLVNAYFFAYIIDAILQYIQNGNKNIEGLYPLLGIILIYNLATGLIYNINGVNKNITRLNSRIKWKQLLYLKIHSLGIQTLEDPEIENKIIRAKDSLDSSADYVEKLIIFIARFFKLISATIIIFTFLPILVPLLVITTIPKFITNQHFLRKDWKFFKKNTEYQRSIMADASSLMSSRDLHEIVINSSFKYFDNRYRKYLNFWISFYKNTWQKWYSIGYGLEVIEQLVIMYGYINTFSKLIDGFISIGSTTFYFRTLNIYSSTLAQISTQIADIFEFSVRIKDAKDLFDMQPSFEDGTIILNDAHQAPHIQLKNVSFKYPNTDKWIMRNFNLEIKPGEKVAIVGQNGAGKTTLVKLLSRLYPTTEGVILIDGININDIKIESLYKKMGVLFQEYNTYGHLSAKENIILGDIDAEVNEEYIKHSAELANASEFIEKYKYGYDQILSEKYKEGIRPSTGQWQKIAIARFFYRNAPIVIFDEPTASIDAMSEAKIFSEIYSFFKNKTVIIISHRFSTVRYADRIYVIDNGQIIESGTHQELLNIDGKYAESFKTQAEGYK